MPRRMSSLSEPVKLPGFTDTFNRVIGAYAWLDTNGRVRRYTNQSLADRLLDLGYDYSEGYIRQWREGKRANPAAVILIGLSRAFGGVDIRVWFPEEYPEVHAAVLRELDQHAEALTDSAD